MDTPYRKLTTHFPLRPISDHRQLHEALALIDALLAEDLDQGGQDYLDVLTDLVEIYEDKHFSIPDSP